MLLSDLPVRTRPPPALEGLRGVALLRGLPDAVLADVANASRFKRYAARQTIITRHDVDRDCCFVISGRLRVIAWSPGGREVSFGEVCAGETIGELAAIDGQRRSASVVALTETLLARLSPESLASLLQRHWSICERLMRHLAASTRGLTERVYELSTLGVQQRLCAELLRLGLAQQADCEDALPTQPTLRPAPSHSELAARIGSVRLQVTRELAELERLQLIRRHDQALTLLDVQRLAEHVQDPLALPATETTCNRLAVR